MDAQIERLRVVGLQGCKTIDAGIRDNTLILVGENGSGKTTFLRIVFSFLSGRWFSLLQYRFDYIAATISGTEIKVTREALEKGFERIDRRMFAEFPASVRHRLMDWVSNHELNEVPADLERWLHRSGLPWEAMVRQLELFDENPKGARKDLQTKIRQIRSAIDAQILYLPTYRRIERELGSIFEGIDPDELRKGRQRSHPGEAEGPHIELVEFGMKDVQQAIDGTLVRLKEFARENLNSLTVKYLGDVVDKEYLSVGMREVADVPEGTIASVLDRIHESILTKLHKEHLFSVINAARTDENPNEHSKIICHYFLKLLGFQQNLKERERQISAFCALCSEYIVDKSFAYDSAAFGFAIVPKNSRQQDKNIELGDLSSGEKQIVSLFSHLYLSGKARHLVIIDEPELSLSVPWQRRFLSDIRTGDNCTGLIAATHSPFIYENDLRRYTHSLGEFVTLRETEGPNA